MLKSRKVKRLFALMLAMSMVWLAGCQAIAGYDVNKALQSSLNYTSYEGNFTIEIGFDLKEGIAADEAVALFSPIRIQLDELKVKDTSTTYANGALSFGVNRIPFELYADPNQVAAKIDGLDKPLALNVSDLQSELTGDVALDMAGFDADLLQAVMMDVVKVLAPYMIKQLPNPQTISIAPVTESINGQSLSMHKIHVELSGDELPALLEQFIANIAKDEEGMTAMLGDLYDLVYPIIKEQIDNGQMTIPPIVATILNNKESAVGFLQGTIAEMLNELTATEEEFSELGEIFNDISLRIDAFIDDQLQVRKVDFAINLDMSGNEASELNEFEISGTSEIWNINGDVDVPIIDISDALTLTDEEDMSEIIEHIDRQSQLYALLKATGLTAKTVQMQLKEQGDASEGAAPYIDAAIGTTFVPVRLASEQLGTEVKWDNTKKQAIVVDSVNDTTITMTLGSDIALLNGEEMTLLSGPQIKNNQVYVPIRFLAESLGAEITFINETKTVILKREL